MPRLEIIQTDDYLVEGWKRYRRAKHGARATLMVKIVLGAVLLLLIWMLVVVRAYVAVGLASIFLLLLVFSQSIDAFLLVRRCRKSPFRGDAFVIQIGPTGLSGKSPKSDTTVDWSAYTSARCFNDGFLLLQPLANYTWLPTHSITEGTADEIDHLLQAHISNYQKV